MAISLPITSRSSSDDLDFADVYGNDAQLVTEIDARDDNYQTIFAMTPGVLVNDQAAGTYMVKPDGQLSTSPLTITATAFPSLFYFDDADYTVASKTQKLRVRAQVLTNATAWSSVTATVGLYPVTFAGGADALTATLGTVVSGSTTPIADPSASAVNQANSGDFTIPADGQYTLAFVLSATLTNNARALIVAQLQTRWT